MPFAVRACLGIAILGNLAKRLKYVYIMRIMPLLPKQMFRLLLKYNSCVKPANKY